ncbi:MAG: hypothetical protein KGZ58_11045 [Ignavibacteriales bacterium]|nr:hypothetical protein [Ignavibacteriales bacterium]
MKITNYELRITFVLYVILFSWTKIYSQTNPNFNVYLDVNYRSAEAMFDVLERRFGNAEELAAMRGNQIALATSLMIENRWESGVESFRDHLQKIKSGVEIENDVFQFQRARDSVAAMKEVLRELQRRNFQRRVTATVEQLFPSSTKINVQIPVYVVAFGTEKVDAFVRRIVWENDIPHFVGEGEGELTIVINLSRVVELEDNLDSRFLSILSTVAHEVFHVAFGDYQDHSKQWQRFRKKNTAPVFQLLELVQNEGIAYYFSLEQRGRGYLPHDWNERTQTAMDRFNAAMEEMVSPDVSRARKYELVRTSNTSGFWESYGSISGMVMARAIENNFGKAALVETIEKGVLHFFDKYREAMFRDRNLPPLNDTTISFLDKK